MQKAALYTSAIFFAVGSAGHLVRLGTGMEIVIGGYVLPLRVSAPGTLIAALLSLWMVVVARRA